MHIGQEQLIRELGELKPDDYPGCFYESDEEYESVFSAFVGKAFDNGQKVISVLNGHSSSYVFTFLQDSGIDPQSYRDNGQLCIIDSHDKKLNGDSLESMLKEIDQAFDEGWPGVRVSLDMAKIFDGMPNKSHYRDLLNHIHALNFHKACMVLCMYDRRVCAPEIVMEAISTHPMVITSCEVVENKYYVPSDVLTRQDVVFSTVSNCLAGLVSEKQREKELEGLSEKYCFLFENTSDFIFVHDLDGYFREINLVHKDVEGYTEKDLVGLNLRDLIPQDIKHEFDEYMERIKKNGKCQGLIRVQDKAGTERIFEYKNILLQDESGPTGVRGLAQDITERFRAKEALKRSEERYRDIFNNVSDFLYFHDLEGNFDFSECNFAVMDTWGGVEKELAKRNLKELIPERFQDQFPGYLERIQKNSRDEGLICVIANDGKEHILEYKNSLVRDKTGPIGVRGSARDITENIQAERKIRKSEEKYRTILESIEEGYYEVNMKGTLIFFNNAFCNMIGYSRQEMMGMRYRKFMDRENAKKVFSVFSNVYSSERPEKGFGWEFIRKDGGRIQVDSSILLMKGSDGEPIGFRGVLCDVTERKQAEGLKAAKMKAEAENRAKSEFLANMSHEIRTPLNGIIGMAELAMDTDLDDNQRDIICAVNKESDTLLALINDILDFSKIEADKLDFESIAFDLQILIEDLTGSFAIRSEKKGLEFISFLSPDVPSRLIGDPARLRQVLSNLASNALKFTDTGEIYIKAEIDQDLGDQVKIRFFVKDTGIGISENKQKKIFNSFTQADGSTTRKYGGTGLGLTISKRIVEMMSGDIGVESEEGKGSSFWFTALFLKQKDQTISYSFQDIDPSGLRVLVVDDNETNRFILTEYLKGWGCLPVESPGGQETISILRAAIALREPIDLILMDFQMPGINGFDLTKEIRKVNSLKEIPIIVLTSLGDLGDGKSCRDIGIQGYLPKPMRRDDLRKALVSVMGLSQEDKGEDFSRLVTRHTIAEDFRKDVQILLAEDYPTNQQVAMRHLQKAGYQVDIVENGRQAVSACKRKRYDLVLMDIQMPVMDGYTATKEIREWEDKFRKDALSSGLEKLERIPIIAMTAHAIKGYREKSIRAGMDDYIAKPLRRKELLGLVDKWAKVKCFPEREHLCFKNTGMEKSTMNNSQGDLPIDLERAFDEFECDEDFLDELLKEFIMNVKDQIKVIRTAISDNDLECVWKEAHSIKGGAANLTADDLSSAALELEQIGKSGLCEDGKKALVRLEEELDRLVRYSNRSESTQQE
jgi:two-component system sensor histidine kinase/response regulator